MVAKAYSPSICPGIPRLGKCPRGWSTRTFEQILRVVERPAAIEDDTEYQLVNAKRSRGGIVPREKLKGREIKTKDQYIVRGGDFLIANRQIIHGACGIVPPALDGALVSGEYTVLHANDGLSLQWFTAFTHTPYFQLTCFHSSIGVDVEKMVFKLDWWLKHDLHVPPLNEQEKIAEILSTWDAAIVGTRALIDASARRKISLMQQLVTGRRRLPSFRSSGGKASKKGRSPEGWRSHMIGELGEVVAGGTPDTNDQAFWDGNVPWATPTDITRLTSPFIASTERRITPLGLKASAATLLPHNSLIVCTRATVGDCAVNTVPMTTNQGFKNLIVSSTKADVLFLYYWVSANKHALMRLAAGSTFLEVPKSSFEAIAIDCPPLPEQHAIAAVLTTADEEINCLKAKCAALERQKKGLMQKLLTGEVRVSV